MIERPFLFDTTRLVSRSWTRRRSTGIDRVCYAYLRNFGARAQAVVQHRGVVRILTARHSDMFIDMLLGSDEAFRTRLMAFAPYAMAQGASLVEGRDAIYLNVGHTDFDLASHIRWTHNCRLRPVYLVHDLIPITHPEFCRPRSVARHRGRVVNALQSAAGIVVNSQATARELGRFARDVDLPLPPVLAAPLAGADLARPAEPVPAPMPYFVCLGTIESRKNHSLLLQVWRRLVDRMGERAPHLLMIGAWGVNSGRTRALLETDSALRARVRVVEDCSDEMLGGYLARARALLLPTFAEGFGLPLVEALQLGTPAIASDLPCFREIGQGIPTLLDPREVEEWTRMIGRFIGECPERRRQLALLPRFRRSEWAEHFAGVEAWFETLRGSSGMAAPRECEARPVSRVDGAPRAGALAALGSEQGWIEGPKA